VSGATRIRARVPRLRRASDAPPPGADGGAAGPPPGRDRRWVLTRVVAPAAVFCAAGIGVGVWALTRDGSDASDGQTAATSTTIVTRRDLVDRETFSGSLGYGESRDVTNFISGAITRLPNEGDIMRRGAVLYRVDNTPVVLMYGATPAYRTMESGVSDGPDVEQLERNLRDMGYDPDGAMSVDGDFDADTADAVERWQEAVGLEETGRVDRGRAVFMPGARRVGTIQAKLGGQAGPGTPIMSTTGTARSVTVNLDARRQDLVRAGAEERVELPDGKTVDATVTEIGTVAKAASEDEHPSVAVTLTLDQTKGVTRIDGAPVDVHIAKETRKDALSVPVTALLALAGGGYGLEVVDDDGSHRIVAVDPGLYADGYVEVSGRGIEPGTRVVTAT